MIDALELAWEAFLTSFNGLADLVDAQPFFYGTGVFSDALLLLTVDSRKVMKNSFVLMRSHQKLFIIFSSDVQRLSVIPGLLHVLFFIIGPIVIKHLLDLSQRGSPAGIDRKNQRNYLNEI